MKVVSTHVVDYAQDISNFYKDASHISCCGYFFGGGVGGGCGVWPRVEFKLGLNLRAYGTHRYRYSNQETKLFVWKY